MLVEVVGINCLIAKEDYQLQTSFIGTVLIFLDPGSRRAQPHYPNDHDALNSTPRN